MVTVVIRFQDDSVVAFDAWGQRLPRYQGRYEDVRERLLAEASPEAVFAHGFSPGRGSGPGRALAPSPGIRRVPRGDW